MDLKESVLIHYGALGLLCPSVNEEILKERDKIINELKRKEELESVLKELFNNHIELVKGDGGYWFRIKNTKGKEYSCTSLNEWFSRFIPIVDETSK